MYLNNTYTLLHKCQYNSLSLSELTVYGTDVCNQLLYIAYSISLLLML